MKNQHRVVWTKGMFLNPQHFQTQDQYFEDTLQFRFSSSNYANWGVTTLDIDTEVLATGTFRLIEARGILPDGLTFRMPDVDELPPSRDFDTFFSATAKELDVYLAIPENRLQSTNVVMPSAGSKETPDSRYSSETLM